MNDSTTQIDQVSDIIKEHGVFHTPETHDDILDWIDRFPQGERPALLTASMMTWNLCASIIQRVKDGEFDNE